MVDEEYDEQEERAERMSELKSMLAGDLEAQTSVQVEKWQLEDDLYVSGPLSEIIEWAQAYRSEIEELGV